jgi:hypothetical protein
VLDEQGSSRSTVVVKEEKSLKDLVVAYDCTELVKKVKLAEVGVKSSAHYSIFVYSRHGMLLPMPVRYSFVRL